VQRSATPSRPILVLAAAVVLVGILAIPTIAASPNPPRTAGPTAASPAPDVAQPSSKPRFARGNKPAKVPEVEVTPTSGAGRPAWAGGWKRVGGGHPDWTQEKWEKLQAKLAERIAHSSTDCWPPGRCRTPGEKRTNPSTTPEPSPGG
jgi:hypothetical protein